MNCRELLQRLADYADGTLPDGLCAEIQRHLRDCGPCEDLRRDLEDLSRLCRQSPPPRLPEGLRLRIQRLLRES